MKILASIILTFLLLSFGFAQNPDNPGSNALLHTSTSETYAPGKLELQTNLNFFTKLGEFLGDPVLKPSDFRAANYWLVASNVAFTYGIAEHWDATVGLRLYQDTHYSNEFNLPDDIFVTVKTGSHFFGRRKFAAAFMGSARIATGEIHNYPFAEYASGAFEFGFMTALSFYIDPYLRDRAFSMHYNIGWWNHNEAGTTLYEFKNGNKLDATVNSSHLQMNLGAVIPAGQFDLRLELSGILYTKNPDKFVYSAEEWAFFSPSIRYKPYDWISMDLGIDFRISPKDRQNTEGIPDISNNLDLPPNYPPWKVQMGLNMAILPFGKSIRERSDAQHEEFKKRVEFYEVVKDQEKKAKNIEQELNNLRKERENADKEIEELRKMLEEEG